MNNIWKWSQEYPGSIPTTPFKEYIRHNQIGTDYYYSAYPGATTNDVKSALHLRQEYSDFVQEHGDKPPDLFEEEFQRFLVREWVNNGNDFNLGNDKDPITGSGNGHMLIPGDATNLKKQPTWLCPDLPRFVETRGGEYFFLPSITALRLIATETVEED